MRPQQVSVDIWKMVISSGSYLALAVAAWVFLKLAYACFWLPGQLKKEVEAENLQDDVTKLAERVEEKKVV